MTRQHDAVCPGCVRDARVVVAAAAVVVVCQLRFSTTSSGSAAESFQAEDAAPVKEASKPTSASSSAVVADGSASSTVRLRFTKLAVSEDAVKPVSSHVFSWTPAQAPYTIVTCNLGDGTVATLQPPSQVRLAGNRDFGCQRESRLKGVCVYVCICVCVYFSLCRDLLPLMSSTSVRWDRTVRWR